MEGRHRLRARAAQALIPVLVLGIALAVLPPATAAQSVEELKRIISEREAEIRELRQRLDKLEKSAAPPLEEDEETTRALERTLVQQGGLVLRPGVYELEPQLGYSHWDKTRPPLRSAWLAGLNFRAGLGWDSQVQVRVPYLHVSSVAGSETALGDIDVVVSRELSRDSGRWPGLVAAVGWTSRTGKDGFGGGAPTGGGFNVVQAGLTAVKRQDPLVFYGGLSYAGALSREVGGVKVQPGDTLGVRFGGILAASPHSSVTLGMNYGFVGETRLNGQGVFDSDTVLGTLQIGVATVLSRRMLLNLTGDLRITGNVPDFRLTATLPIRF
jgi:hypothetical protein